jgi:DNA-binding beta-propeller fold protein YncE
MLVNFNAANASTIENLQLTQILKDDDKGVDGLGNPRRVQVILDNSKVFVSSGDDNALAIFNVDHNFNLTFSQIFRNSSDNINGLEGASGIAYLDQGEQVVVTGFYDGALTRFSKNKNRYRFNETISDVHHYERVFNSDMSLGKLDRLGLLGAWDVIKTHNEKQLLVAGYMSNAVAIFDITSDGRILFNRAIKDASPLEKSLGKPVSLALSLLNDELYVLGFDSHQLTIFDRKDRGDLLVKQVIKNGVAGVEQFVNPQKIVVSPAGNFLYVACSGSNAIVVFQKKETGHYAFLQAVNNADIGGSGLEGASSLAMSSDGSKIYAAGEAGHGFYLFSAGVDGRLIYNSKLLTVRDNEIKRISSLTLTDDNQHLLVATGKGNALFVFNITSS